MQGWVVAGDEPWKRIPPQPNNLQPCCVSHSWQARNSSGSLDAQPSGTTNKTLKGTRGPWSVTLLRGENVQPFFSYCWSPQRLHLSLP